MSMESVMPSSHLILCHPLLLLPPIPPSITVFSDELTLHMRWPKYWSFSLSISPSNEHPGLVFRMDWLDLLSDIKMLVSLRSWMGGCSMTVKASGFAKILLFWTYPPKCKTHNFFPIWISLKSWCSCNWWYLPIAGWQSFPTAYTSKSSRTKLAENCGDISGGTLLLQESSDCEEIVGVMVNQKRPAVL